jgi:hypothetical protein
VIVFVTIYGILLYEALLIGITLSSYNLCDTVVTIYGVRQCEGNKETDSFVGGASQFSMVKRHL